MAVRAQALVNFAAFEIADAIQDGFLDVAAGHFHEVAFLILFFDQRTKMSCRVQ
jgi:hypothetical protein